MTGKWSENCWIVSDQSGVAVVIDPGDSPDEIVLDVESRSLRPAALLVTHAHHDHLGAVAALHERWGAPFYLHPADAPLVKRMNFFRRIFDGSESVRVPPAPSPLAPGADLVFGDLTIRVLHTPGHTPGSVTFRIGDLLFPGDLLLAAGAGRTDLPGGDEDRLRESLAILLRLPPELVIHPGHGDPFPVAVGAELSARRRTRPANAGLSSS